MNNYGWIYFVNPTTPKQVYKLLNFLIVSLTALNTMEDLYLDLYVASWFDDIEYYEKLEKEWQEYCQLNP